MKTILLIDHDAEHLERQGEQLRRAGYRIVDAGDGRTALCIIGSGMLLNLIVTEYAMPDMDPRDFLAAVRMKAPGVPVIVVTCRDSLESYIHAIKIGVCEYLSKPLLPDALYNIVRTTVQARKPGNRAQGGEGTERPPGSSPVNGGHHAVPELSGREKRLVQASRTSIG